MTEFPNPTLYDVAIIGAGVVGCAMARRFTIEGARVLVLEKSTDLISGASKGNSAIMHTGFDAPPGSLELQCMQAGYREYMEIAGRLGLPVLQTGAIVAAWSDDELGKLDAIEAQALENNVRDVVRLTAKNILAREPHVSPNILGGLLVPGEHIIDPWSAPLAYLTQAVQNGAQVVFGAEMMSAARASGNWEMATSKGSFRASFIINCAGLFGDRLETIFLGESAFEIKPRKGQFVVFDKSAAQFIGSILLPVPTERTKGIVIARTAFGNVLVGPTAEEQDDRGDASTDRAMLEMLIAQAGERVPALAKCPVTATYAGLRPASEKKEYRIRVERDLAYITVGGIRSTGLTASLGLAQHIFEVYSTFRENLEALPKPVWPQMPNLAEHQQRDWEQPGDNEIICHCELVTRREIEASFASSIPPGDFGGLKRRTRVCMGRCQGFYCQAQVAALTQGFFELPLATAAAHE